MIEPDLNDPKDYGSILRNNLMKRPGYMPYCGGNPHFRRAEFDGEQFVCVCGWRSEIPADFMSEYKARWHTTPAAQREG